MHIVVGADASTHSLAAAHFVRDLQPPPGSRVTILATLSPGQTSPRPEIQRTLDKIQTVLTGKRIDVQTTLLRGQHIGELVQFTEQNAADLLVIGERNTRSRLGIFIDGTPQQLVDSLRCPVLVAHTPHKRLRHVLLAVDFTWSNRRAVQYLEQFHLPSHTKVSVLHVQPPEEEGLDDEPAPAVEQDSTPRQPNASAFWGLLPFALQTSTTSPEDGRGLLHYASDLLRAVGGNASPQSKADTATAITNYARRHHVDLVIAGSRTIHQMTSWITEEIAQKLIHNTGCDVLIAKEGMGS
jgi:nucleotide-binding universal stress UspA family protein